MDGERQRNINKILMTPFKYKVYIIGQHTEEIWSKTKKYFNEHKSTRYKWGEISTGFSGLGLSYQEAGDDSYAHLHIMPIFGNIFIHLNRKYNYDNTYEEERQWGFTYYFSRDMRHDIHLKFGDKSKIIELPTMWEWQRTSTLLNDGTWDNETKGNRKPFTGEENLNIFKETHTYTYTLESGVVQRRKATITVREMEWRRRALQWTNKFNMVIKSIDINFDEEVGERSGSWKGGCIGCGYNMNKNETPYETLKRMQKERKF